MITILTLFALTPIIAIATMIASTAAFLLVPMSLVICIPLALLSLIVWKINKWVHFIKSEVIFMPDLDFRLVSKVPSTNLLRLVLSDYLVDYPMNSSAIASFSEDVYGRTQLMVNFTTPTQRWEHKTYGHSFAEACSRLKGRLLKRPKTSFFKNVYDNLSFQGNTSLKKQRQLSDSLIHIET